MPAITIDYYKHRSLPTTSSNDILFCNTLTQLCNSHQIPDALHLVLDSYESAGIMIPEYKTGLQQLFNANSDYCKIVKRDIRLTYVHPYYVEQLKKQKEFKNIDTTTDIDIDSYNKFLQNKYFFCNFDKERFEKSNLFKKIKNNDTIKFSTLLYFMREPDKFAYTDEILKLRNQMKSLINRINTI